MARILIVEDEDALRDVLSRYLTTQGYDCDWAENGEVGANMVRAMDDQGGYDVILSDIEMPRMNGLEFLRSVQSCVDRRTPFLILTAYDRLEYATQAMRLGACNFLQKNPFDLAEISNAVERAYEIRQGYLLRRNYQAQMEEELEAKKVELASTYYGTVVGFAAMMEGKDASTMAHLFRVRDYCSVLARELGVPDKPLRNLELGSMLHDIGKYSIPDAILTKPGSLTEEEWEIMRMHPSLGAGFVRRIPFLSGATDVIQNHHERYDGGGYPSGLRAQEIPLSARIFSVVDAYDAIVSKRCYKAAQPPAAALMELRRCSGTQFDPQVVEAFERVLPEIVASMDTFDQRFRDELESLGLGEVEDRSRMRQRIQRSA